MTSCTAEFRGISILLAGVLMSACQSRPDEAAPKAAKLTNRAPVTAPSAPTIQELKNATYQGVEEAGAPFALANGKWEGKPYEPGGASAPSVTFARDFRLTGDLDGDGAEEAVVLLAAGTGGTGEMSYVAVVGRPGGNVTNVATAPIGDRVQVRNARIAERRVVLDVVQAGEIDAACCPGDLVTRGWEQQAGALKEGAAAKTGRLSNHRTRATDAFAAVVVERDPILALPEQLLVVHGEHLDGRTCRRWPSARGPRRTPG